jgi:D-glycero-D-manno-heptose 1,7-bisphosphate phosphatase
MTIKTIFLDRDGVINKEVNYLYKIDQFKFLNGVFNACKKFLELEFKIIVITNQSGIARGYYSVNDYENLTNWMLSQFKNQGISILDTFYCPHMPESNCACRKPNPGMFIAAKNKHNIDMDKSWVIGDKETDIEAAKSAGIPNRILVRSGHKIIESNSKASFIIDSIENSSSVISLS